MADINDLRTAIGMVGAAVDAAATRVIEHIPPPPDPVDFTPEVASLQAIKDKADTISP